MLKQSAVSAMPMQAGDIDLPARSRMQEGLMLSNLLAKPAFGQPSKKRCSIGVTIRSRLYA